MDGILLINKPAGYTSHDIVGIVRKKLHTKKVGHCGTLDPDATGVLVVCVNKATKAIQFLMSDTKVYRATLSLGKSTDTYDASGKILEEKEVGQISQAQVIDVYGVLDHVLLAKHFKTLMMYIGKDVQVIDQVTGQKRSACLADESHCAIIISYSGQTREMVEVAEIYHKRNIPFISITCMAENSISRLADVHLYLSSREMLHIKIGDFASTTSLKYLFDILYAGVFSYDYKKNLETKIVVASYVDDRQSEDEYINEK